MARIIRTTPKNRQKTSLRVAISFLLIMQIQAPDAHHSPAGTRLSFIPRPEATVTVQLTKAEDQALKPETLDHLALK